MVCTNHLFNYLPFANDILENTELPQPSLKFAFVPLKPGCVSSAMSGEEVEVLWSSWMLFQAAFELLQIHLMGCIPRHLDDMEFR